MTAQEVVFGCGPRKTGKFGAVRVISAEFLLQPAWIIVDCEPFADIVNMRK